MALPNMTLRADSELWAECEGIPDNGDNTFEIPFAKSRALGGSGLPVSDVQAEWLIFYTFPTDPAVPGVTSAGPCFTLADDGITVTLPFVADGIGTCKLVCQLVHTIPR